MRLRRAELALRNNSPEIRHANLDGENRQFIVNRRWPPVKFEFRKIFSTADGQYRERSASGFPP